MEIGYRGASPMYVKLSFGQWAVEALIAIACGYDDMRLAVHKTASLVGADFADGKGRGVSGG